MSAVVDTAMGGKATKPAASHVAKDGEGTTISKDDVTDDAKKAVVTDDAKKAVEALSKKPQLYIAVPAALLKTIVMEGYKCTERDAVPFQFDRDNAVRAFLNFHMDETNIAVLSVRGVEEDLIQPDATGQGGVIKSKILDPKHLFEDIIVTRSHRADETPCPFCGTVPPPDLHREQIGLARYRHSGDGKFFFLGCDCCEDRWAERQDRLNKGLTLTLYHATSRKIADLIQRTGKMRRGDDGNAGGGIYFAETRRETEWKALKGDPSSDDSRIVLKCEVQLGHVREEFHKSETGLIPELTGITFAQMMQFSGNKVVSVEKDNKTAKEVTNDPGPKDSVYLKRGMSKYGKSGDEIIVYSWDQVKVLGEVPRDKLK
eukprot:TRINITY_DN2718_c0_g1_i1.p1 TRINITY_DN2718_c0_g1~~TRINITY_DN2718_c0_g1_i1.p1  ORF type:complete len:373 (+),score=69.40 TRINITY_DN2718_c0_g1_i1:43-1161(+)